MVSRKTEIGRHKRKFFVRVNLLVGWGGREKRKAARIPPIDEFQKEIGAGGGKARSPDCKGEGGEEQPQRKMTFGIWYR